MTILKDTAHYVEQDSRSPIYSHQEGYNEPVHAICHHSGRYLTRSETNPASGLLWLREQHDFPGLPRLDRSFYRAAHSKQHQHWIWSKPGIQGTIMVLSGGLVIALAYYTGLLSDFVATGLWLWLYWAIIILLTSSSLIFIGYGLNLILRREEIFHERSQGMPPAVPDFPLKCTYDIFIEENVSAQLGNVFHATHNMVEQNGRITTTIIPIQNELETFEEFKKRYESHPVGRKISAGAIALTGVEGIQFLAPNVDFDHRIILRAPSSNLQFDTTRETYKRFALTTNYTISPNVLYRERHGLKQFFLQCEPKIAHNDSRTLELCFTWQPLQANHAHPVPKIVLEECVLESISDDYLKPVTLVIHGRYDRESEQVIWRNLQFRPTLNGALQLSLYVTFEYPLLNCLEHIVGKYRLRINGLVSNLQLTSNQIWTAWGLKAEDTDSLIQKRSIIQGELHINPQLLSQEHEHVTLTQPILCPHPPNAHLIEKVLDIVQSEGFEIQKISQAPPRLHPTGRLDARLHYWDIVGRRYNAETLDAIDIHLVISGQTRVSQLSTKQQFEPCSQIDVRLRCLHDPRNQQTAEQADTLIGTLVDDRKAGLTRMPTDMPANLHNHLREILKRCGPFRSDEELRHIFVDNRISQWQSYLPETNRIMERVDAVIGTLHARENGDNQNALALLLTVLQERIDSGDTLHHQLKNLSEELVQYTTVNTSDDGQSRIHAQPGLHMLGLVNRIQQALNDDQVIDSDERTATRPV